MPRPPSPTLSDLTDQAAGEWSPDEIQGAARIALRSHHPDHHEDSGKRHGVLPWLRRNHAVCARCGEPFPCITRRYAAQLLSAGRLPAARPASAEISHRNNHRDHS